MELFASILKFDIDEWKRRRQALMRQRADALRTWLRRSRESRRAIDRPAMGGSLDQANEGAEEHGPVGAGVVPSDCNH